MSICYFYKYTREPGFLSYEICTLIKNEKWTREFDDVYQVLYAYKGGQFVTYDDTQSLKLKVGSFIFASSNIPKNLNLFVQSSLIISYRDI